MITRIDFFLKPNKRFWKVASEIHRKNIILTLSIRKRYNFRWILALFLSSKSTTKMTPTTPLSNILIKIFNSSMLWDVKKHMRLSLPPAKSENTTSTMNYIKESIRLPTNISPLPLKLREVNPSSQPNADKFNILKNWLSMGLTYKLFKSLWIMCMNFQAQRKKKAPWLSMKTMEATGLFPNIKSHVF